MEVLLEHKLTLVEEDLHKTKWVVVWEIWMVAEAAAANLAVNSHPVELVEEEEIIKFMLETLMRVLQIQCFFMSSNFTFLLFMKPKSFVIQFQEKVKGTVLLNSQIKKRANAPFKKCLENLLAVDKLKWIMQVKETDNSKTHLSHLVDSGDLLKEDMDKTQWMEVCHLNNMDYQEDTVNHHQWERHLNMVDLQILVNMEHLLEWWEVNNETQERNTEAECHHMVKVCMVKEDLQVITEWIEEATVEWDIWEWVDLIHICNSINNMVELQLQANMAVPQQEWAVPKVIKVVHQWIHVEATPINRKMVLHLNIILQATVKEAQTKWVTWEAMANHHKVSIHLHTTLAVKPVTETSHPQQTSMVKTQMKPKTNLQACQTLRVFSH